MSYNFMTYKTNGIAQVFQKTKNKFNNIKLFEEVFGGTEL